MNGGDIFEIAGKTISQPAALSFGKHEIHWNSKQVMQKYFANLQAEDIHFLDKGGHFLATEEPELLAQEMSDFFGRSQVKRLLA